MTSIELKAAPELKKVVTIAFPDYRKHKAYYSAFPESGIYINSYWDGGSKDEYAVVNLATMKRGSLPTSTHPFFDVQRYGIQGENDFLEVGERGNIRLKQLPENFALVQAGYFCGKPATAHVYFPTANMPKLLQS